MTKRSTLAQTEVLTPIWVLKEVVEKDWKTFQQNNVVVEKDMFPEFSIDEDDDEAMVESPIGFPELDSTAKCLEILEKYDIQFDTKRGDWV